MFNTGRNRFALPACLSKTAKTQLDVAGINELY